MGRRVDERPDRIDFPGASEEIPVAEWPVGRIFGESAELCWEPEGEAFRTRLAWAGPADLPDGFRQELALNGLAQETLRYYMWGEDDINVGGRLDYTRAIPGPGRGRVRVIEYRDPAGRLVFYRYAGLEREV